MFSCTYRIAPFPTLPPPSIIEADLETYIMPLIMNGWYISAVRRRTRLKAFDLPSLNRTYRFHDYSSAQDFFRAVVPLLPAPTLLAGAQMKLNLNSSTVQLLAIKEADNVAIRRTTPTTMEQLWNCRDAPLSY
ncbi:hypothetical protein B0H17DRAFT_1206810 [Mycena rosella]|uniref:Uncharacterized protein n=1 Tax=Mycena rosella TaxID=1033263 RepID=A0AAD7D4P7_MYCRO|nr:hypothetical protein B0H17DRAFT_1206810 [Mycena rosella]